MALLVTVAFVSSAWISDDAYISFRTIDNALAGHGLRWNPAERVQTFTHPLWLCINLLAVTVTGEFYYTNLATSFLLLLLTVWLMITKLAVRTTVGIGAVILLLGSKAYVDYASSGLEDPLTRLLLVVYVMALAQEEGRPVRHGFSLAVLASLGCLCRPDALLFFIPGLLVALYRQRRSVGRFGCGVFCGLLPLFLWGCFALYYYGTPFPNTAYAKLGMGVPRLGLLVQGLSYYLDSLTLDPLTLMTMAGALWIGFKWRDTVSMTLMAGVLLYLAFVLWIGGDYMSGRLLGSPFLLSVVVLARHPWQEVTPRHLRLGLAVAIPLLAVRATMPLVSNSISRFGVGDQRRTHHPYTGLLYAAANQRWPDHRFRALGEKASKGPQVQTARTIGMIGFYAGPEIHIVDVFALGDPLLSRLPAVVVSALPRRGIDNWHPGHGERPIPPGYIETLESGERRIEDPGLASYYQVLRLITRGDLLSRDRLHAIIKMNLGHYDHLIDTYVEENRERFRGFGDPNEASSK